ncbi:hypothetical protein KI387_015349, partial [Taxus chinensis]
VRLRVHTPADLHQCNAVVVAADVSLTEEQGEHCRRGLAKRVRLRGHSPADLHQCNAAAAAADVEEHRHRLVDSTDVSLRLSSFRTGHDP